MERLHPWASIEIVPCDSTFTLIISNWMESEWNTIWSSSGSASEMIWPYWLDTLLHSEL